MRRLFAALAIASILAGCAALRPAPGIRPASGPPKLLPSALQAEAIVEITRTLMLRGKASISAQAPDKFRIEVFGPFGYVAARYISDGVELATLDGDRMESRPWGDPAAPFPFTSGEIASFLLGSVADGSNDTKVTRDEAGRPVRVESLRGGKTLLVEMSEYMDVSGAHIPFRISISDGNEKLSINYSTVEVNPELRPDLFRTGP